MIYFLYGSESYLSRLKLDEIKQKFSVQDAGLGSSFFDSQTCQFSDIKKAIENIGFFSKYNLVVVKNALSLGKADFKQNLADILAKVPNETVLVFYEENNFDKRSSLYKKLKKVAKTKEFLPLSSAGVINFIIEKFNKEGVSVTPSVAEKLAYACNKNLWRIESEIVKLSNFKKTISEEDVEQMVSREISANIFDLIDAISHKNLRSCAHHLQDLIDSGENEIYIQTMIIYQLRNILQIKSLADEGKSRYEIEKQTGLHPFVVQKTFSQINNFSLPILKKIYAKLLDADFSIKTGKIDPRLSLDLLLVGLCR